MLESIIDWLVLFMAFKTPYPYIVILTVLLGILMYSIAFIEIKNSWAGGLSVCFMLCVLVFSLSVVGQSVWQPEEDAVVDKTHKVTTITPQGLKLSSGDVVMPAGTRFVKRLSRHYKSMQAAIEEITDGKTVTCAAAAGGYEVITSDNINVGEYLVERGLVYTNEHATSRMKSLEEAAKQQRQGLWAGGWRAGPERQGGVFAALWTAFITVVQAFVYVVGGIATGAFVGDYLMRQCAVEEETAAEAPKKKKKK